MAHSQVLEYGRNTQLLHQSLVAVPPAEEWLAEFDTGFAAVAGRFARVEPRRRARAFLLGLLSEVDTRSCWQLGGAGR